MEFRRSGQLDDRRRRVLMDEIASPAADDAKDESTPASFSSSSRAPVRAYADAVLAERQPKVTDLVPQRPFLVATLILTGLTIPAAIIAAYTQLVVATAGKIPPRFAALDLTQRGNLADWFSSLLLTGGAVGALVIFSMRAHRVDDYRGRYRIWLWTAAALLFAGIDAATGLHHAIAAALELASGTALQGSENLCWLSVYALAFGTLATRLAIEKWNSLSSFATLAGAALLYLLSGLAAMNVFPSGGVMIDAVVGVTLASLAHLTLITAIALYARHVHLDAQGRLLVSVQKEKAKKPRSRAKLSVVKDDSEDGRGSSSRKTKAAAEKAEKTPSSPATPAAGSKSESDVKFAGTSSSASSSARPAAISAKGSGASSYQVDDEDDDEEDYGGQNVSKAERKKLKRLARRDQQRRAA
jgi:hypothetical protein